VGVRLAFGTPGPSGGATGPPEIGVGEASQAAISSSHDAEGRKTGLGRPDRRGTRRGREELTNEARMGGRRQGTISSDARGERSADRTS